MSTSPIAHTHPPLDSAVHRRLLLALIERGSPATVPELVAAIDSSYALVRESLARLEANHGVVMHPGTLEPWIVHPFSTTPTLFFVTNSTRGWWAPCVWCALGVAVLVPGPVRIHTVLAGESEACVIHYDHGSVGPAGLLAHFPIPVARACDNVHRHCACTLVFSNRASIERWCGDHGIEGGEVVRLETVALLAQEWYGEHLSPEWKKATAAEARARFARVGLTSAHWNVPGSDGRF